MKKQNHGGRLFTALVLCLVAIGAIAAYCLFMPMSKTGDTEYVYIDTDDDIDSVMVKIESVSRGTSVAVFRFLADYTDYGSHIRTGRYAVDTKTGVFQTFRHFRNGQQASVMLTVPSVRTKERLAEELAGRLMMSSDELSALLTDETVCEKYGLDTLTIQTLFIPNTYDIYWNISPENLLERMKKESDRFWTPERKGKAATAGMSPVEVITLASIIDEETANDAEKPMVAGMYINRLKASMPLQADPTIKYAWRRFDLRRIYNKLLFIDSPYNTYRNTGLPPGPIRIPSVAGIDAVLNHIHHNYMYMCAKEDFSGTHNFAVTYEEHLKNAAKYSEALNRRGIK
ncbi:MAG: endolytic transglycosylase MltG [Prevotella sp.]